MTNDEFWSLRFHKGRVRPEVHLYWYKFRVQPYGVEVVDVVDCHLSPAHDELLFQNAEIVKQVHKRDYTMPAGWWKTFWEHAKCPGI